MSAGCIITGCALVDPTHERWVHGDLWVVGTSWVFNAVMNRQGDTAWNYEAFPAIDRARALVIRRDAAQVDYFERRGVIVLAREAAELNPPAVEYVVLGRSK